jgi:hypothetical protein
LLRIEEGLGGAGRFLGFDSFTSANISGRMKKHPGKAPAKK